MRKHIDRRVQRVVNNLLPSTAIKGTFGPARTLVDRMEFYHTPGVSIAVIDNFEIDWAHGFGACDTRSKRQVTADTLFQAGSISKSIFALGVMRLVEEGRLGLDEDIRRYLTAWRPPANGGWDPRLTLRQLLSHTAGLTVHGFPGYMASERLPTLVQILNGEFPANTARVEVNLLPGTHYRYSGGGTTVAQQVLVDQLERPFSEIMRELVLDPLGMQSSTYAQPLPRHWTGRAATAHPWKGIPLKGKFHTYPEMAAAGLWTTPTDLAKAGVELLRVLHDRKAPALVGKEIIDTMLRPQLDCQVAVDDEHYGLGFFCSGTDDAFQFGHGGWDEGFVCEMRLYRNTGKGAVVMINSNEGHPMLGQIMRAIASEYDWPEALPTMKKEARITNTGAYVGRYLTTGGVEFRISARGDNLLLEYGQQPPLPIFAASGGEFFTKAVNGTIRFGKDARGEALSMTVSQEGKEIHAMRQPCRSCAVRP